MLHLATGVIKLHLMKFVGDCSQKKKLGENLTLNIFRPIKPSSGAQTVHRPHRLIGRNILSFRFSPSFFFCEQSPTNSIKCYYNVSPRTVTTLY
jgi:hypothetical protein